MEVIKLYKLGEDGLRYWEAWENEGRLIVHHGLAGEDGEVEDMKATKSARDKVEVLRKQKEEEGYAPIPDEEMAVLMIEYKIDGMGNEADLEKRREVEDRMDNLLGWMGLGHCDGGSSGSGTMEVCCLVVDFDIAKRVIEEDLEGTEFGNFERIYRDGE